MVGPVAGQAVDDARVPRLAVGPRGHAKQRHGPRGLDGLEKRVVPLLASLEVGNQPIQRRPQAPPVIRREIPKVYVDPVAQKPLIFQAMKEKS